MARITDAELFLRRLAELGGRDGGAVTNEALMKQLSWDREKYLRIHGSLRSKKLIVVRQGRGGMVALPVEKAKEQLKVFVSYSHVDKVLKDQLVKHLKPLEREKLVALWVDHQIPAGDDWDREVAKKLREADIVLMLVSIDFINSRYCYDVELEKALERETRGDVRVIPVVLRSCLWLRSPLGRLKALPTDGKAVTTWSDTDVALTNVAASIREVALLLLQSR